MKLRTKAILPLLAVTALIAAGCASEDEEASTTSTTVASVDVKACQVTDSGGVDDKSFNQTANEGLNRAGTELGVETALLESSTEADYEPNIQTFVGQGCDIIIPVGFALDGATQAAAAANPEQLFAIVDVDFFDFSGDTPKDVTFDNVSELTFATDEAAFLAGYTAASVSKSGKVATYGGRPFPTVTIFMDGFLAGVQQYNKDFDKNVEVLGWDGTDGSFTGDFQDQDKGKTTTKNFIDEGADVIMPVAGPVGLGTLAAVKEANNPDISVVWVDVDGCKSVPDSCEYFLTSVEKKMDTAVFDAIKSVVDDTFKGGLYVGTLDNGGVDIAPFQEWDSRVSDEVKEKLVEYRAAIIDGTQSVKPS